MLRSWAWTGLCRLLCEFLLEAEQAKTGLCSWWAPHSPAQVCAAQDEEDMALTRSLPAARAQAEWEQLAAGVHGAREGRPHS